MRRLSRLNIVIIAAPLILIVLPSVAQVAPIEASHSYRTAASIDGWLYLSRIKKDDIVRTGPDVGGSEAQSEGIGVIAAGEKASQAFKDLKLPDGEAWLLHSVTRTHYTGTGWVYAAAFTKNSEKQPDYMGNQLVITVLLDGTVIPVERRKNGG